MLYIYVMYIHENGWSYQIISAVTNIEVTMFVDFSNPQGFAYIGDTNGSV